MSGLANFVRKIIFAITEWKFSLFSLPDYSYFLFTYIRCFWAGEVTDPLISYPNDIIASFGCSIIYISIFFYSVMVIFIPKKYAFFLDTLLYTQKQIISTIISLLTSLSTCDTLWSSMYHEVVHCFTLIFFCYTYVVCVYLLLFFGWSYKYNLYHLKLDSMHSYIARNTCMYKTFFCFQKSHSFCAIYSQRKLYPKIPHLNSEILYCY